jgi:hypothetical protein
MGDNLLRGEWHGNAGSAMALPHEKREKKSKNNDFICIKKVYTGKIKACLSQGVVKSQS